MTINLETVARKRLTSVLATPMDSEQLDAGVNMRDVYGLTSLNKILFITSLCQEMDINLASLTEEDLARMHSLEDVIRILAPYVNVQTVSYL